MTTSPRMEICVVYLAWAGAEPAAVARFVRSLAAHPAGTDHTLVVAWKGYEDPAELGEARQALAGVAHEELVIDAAGLEKSLSKQDMADVIAYLRGGL